MFLVGLCNTLLIYTNLFKLIHQVKTRKSAIDIDIGFAAHIKVEESNLNLNDPKVPGFEACVRYFLKIYYTSDLITEMKLQ